MTVTSRALWRTWTSYRGAPAVTRAFVGARLAIAPLGTVADELADVSGRVVSLGSGISVIERLIAETRPDLSFVGIDLDPRRVAMIERTAARSPRVTLRQGDATDLDDVRPLGEAHSLPEGRRQQFGHAELALEPHDIRLLLTTRRPLRPE